MAISKSNGFNPLYDRGEYPLKLSSHFDWIFEGETFVLRKQPNGKDPKTLGFGSLSDVLQDLLGKDERINFYSNLIIDFAIQENRENLHNLFVVMVAHETEPGFAEDLATEINRRIYGQDRRASAYRTEILDELGKTVLRGPDRGAEFNKKFEHGLHCALPVEAIAAISF